MSSLKQWADSQERRPLILRGARQVGKTWLIESFGHRHIGQCVTLNLERTLRATELFADPSPQANLRAIEALTGKRIEPGKTLLFLDEVQAAPEVLAKLRYFHEDIPSLHIAAAGSLLDFTLEAHTFSMPVGRVSYLYLEPLSFEEFIEALEAPDDAERSPTRDFLRSWNPSQPISTPLHEKLLGLCREYAMIGGMPAAVEKYRKSHSYLECQQLQYDLLATYRDDFAKYAGRVPHPRLLKILNAIPRMVGQKFVFSRVDKEEQTAPLKQALNLLCQARVCHKISASHGNGIPLSAESGGKKFKIIAADTGLMMASMNLGSSDLLKEPDLTLVNEGAIAEQLVGQLLRSLSPHYIDPELYYWVREAHGSEAEVDYLIQNGTDIIPIEVKSGKTGHLKSMRLYLKEKKTSTFGIRICSQPPHFMPELISIPFYLTQQLPRLLKTHLRTNDA